MTDRKELKASIPGIVHSNYIHSESKKRVVSVTVSPECADWFDDLITKHGMEFHGTSYPLKQDTETGDMHIVTRTAYDVSLSGMPKYTDIDDIGKGSEVDLIVKLVEGTARGKKYVSAYLLGIKMYNFIQKEFTSVFDSGDLEKMEVPNFQGGSKEQGQGPAPV